MAAQAVQVHNISSSLRIIFKYLFLICWSQRFPVREHSGWFEQMMNDPDLVGPVIQNGDLRLALEIMNEDVGHMSLIENGDRVLLSVDLPDLAEVREAYYMLGRRCYEEVFRRMEPRAIGVPGQVAGLNNADQGLLRRAKFGYSLLGLNYYKRSTNRNFYFAHSLAWNHVMRERNTGLTNDQITFVTSFPDRPYASVDQADAFLDMVGWH